ncbi:MAG TPA: hypothetical protein VK968_15335 [Roseimicrobium sp.]|nr:hypothetical protein [Roseimicrobium sp.]
MKPGRNGGLVRVVTQHLFRRCKLPAGLLRLLLLIVLVLFDGFFAVKMPES